MALIRDERGARLIEAGDRSIRRGVSSPKAIPGKQLAA